ncbi:MAG: DUF1302 family protein [Stenotrophobium sp.]
MSIYASFRKAALLGGLALILPAGYAPSALALTFTVPVGSNEIDGTLNTTVTLGAQWRMQNQATDLIGKGHLNPDVCTTSDPNSANYSCQGLFKNQFQPSTILEHAPGAYSNNNDQGDLNYNKHDLVSGVSKISQDLQLKFGNFGFFTKALYFYDFVNNNFTEYHPNEITPENLNSVGIPASGLTYHNPGIPGCQSTLADPTNASGKCRTYGKGGVVRSKRTSGPTLEQVGTSLQFLDAYFYGKLPLFGGHDLTFKLGRQTVNWGESTLNAINSINSANPVNANNFYRVGGQVEDFFKPVGMLFLSTDLFEGATIESYYQYEWKPLEAPAAGSFYSGNNIVGTDNAVNWANLSFGQAADDPNGVGWPLNSPLSGITTLTGRIGRLPDHDAKNSGQYGVSLKYYADWLNNGTGMGLYYENYHSRLPFASTFAARASCARGAGSANGNNWAPSLSGNALNVNATDPVTFLTTCPSLPVTDVTAAGEKWQPGAPLFGTDPRTGKTVLSDALPGDTANLWIEYPENIHLLGLSFNTTVGSISLQGEVAYRPNAPLQVNPADLTLAAFGPTLTSCGQGGVTCQGTSVVGAALPPALQTLLNALPGGVNNAATYGASDAGPCAIPYGAGCDTFTLGIGHIDGTARSFPNFILPYRGQTLGQNSPTDFTKPLDQNNPGYIRGFERFKTFEWDLGATQVLGASDMLPMAIGADQVLLLYELGATWVPGLPTLDQLQITSDGGTYTSATAGADGSGGNGSRQACSANPNCVTGSDGLRFSPHQAPLDEFATKFAWGYNIIALIRYESVLPGISIAPQIILKHDVHGNAPGPAENFLQGRKVADVLIETRYKSFLSWSVGYNWIFGAGDKNLLRDRASLRTYLKYQF